MEVSERFLWDLRLTAQELVIENHAHHLKELGRRDGFGLSIEPYDMNPTADMALGGVADVPMCEFWSQGFGFDTRFSCFEATSIAHTLGRPIVAAEAFTATDRRGVAIVSRGDEESGRLGSLYRHQSAGISSLCASAVAGPPSRHDDGALRRALGSHADLVAAGVGLSPVPGTLPVPAAPRNDGGRHLLPGGRKVRRTCSVRPLPPCKVNGVIGVVSISTAVRRKHWWRMRAWRDGRIVLRSGAAYRVLVLPRRRDDDPAIAEQDQAVGGVGRDRRRFATAQVAQPGRLPAM